MIEAVVSEYERDQYAMYLRKSRADLEAEALGEGETLKRHENMLKKLADKMEISADQITVYREIVSGESIQERPEMQRLLADVYKKKYKGVLVVEVERLARGNTKDQGEVADAFQYSNTHIITPSKVYDPNDEFDQEYFEFGLFMSRREYKTITRRMSVGKLQSVQEGNYISSAKILGYDAVRFSKKDRILIENEAESKIVHMIFDWFTIEGLSLGKIAERLTLSGIPTVKGNKEWNRETLRAILKNKHYIGLIVWNQKKTVKEFDPETGKTVKVRRGAEPELYPGKHKPLITEEQFNLVQERFAAQAPVATSKVMVNPLSGLIKCCDCGKSLGYYQAEGKSSRFIHARTILCKKKSVAADVVYDALISALNAHIADFKVKMANDGNQKEMAMHIERIQAMEAELSKQEKKKARLFDSFEDGVYTKDEFLERKQIVGNTIDVLKKQIQEAKKSTPDPVDYEEKIVSIHKAIECIKNPNLDAKSKNDFLKQIIDCIKYDVVDYGRGKGGMPILDVFLR